MELIALIMLLMALCFYIGWLAPLILGIVKLKKGVRTAGIVLTVIGGLWGILAVSMAGFIAVSFTRAIRESNEVPFHAASYRGAVGDIVTSYRGASTLAIRDASRHKTMLLTSVNGAFRAPVGDYQPVRYQAPPDLEKDDVPPTSFTVRIRETRNLSVATGTPARLDIGPPLTARIMVEKPKTNSISLTLMMTDSVGYKYTLEHPTSDPSFVVLDKSGKTVWQGVLKGDPPKEAYGFSGEIPSSVQGTVTIKPVLTKMPLRITIEETKIVIGGP